MGAILIIVLGLFAALTASASVFVEVNVALKLYDSNALAIRTQMNQRMYSSHDPESVRNKIDSLFDLTLMTEKLMTSINTTNFNSAEKFDLDVEINSRVNSISESNSKKITDLLATYDWLWISHFGILSDQKLFEIVERIPNQLDFQKMVLERLSRNYKNHETKPEHYAILFDRVLYLEGNADQRVLQRYGTQGACVSTRDWLPWPISDEPDVDERRKLFGMKSEKSFEQEISA